MKKFKKFLSIILICLFALMDILMLGVKIVNATDEEHEGDKQKETITVQVEQSIDKYYLQKEANSNIGILQQKILVNRTSEVEFEKESLEILSPIVKQNTAQSVVLLVNGKKLEDDSFIYDEKSGILKINIENDNINSLNKKQDEYKIIFRYSMNEEKLENTEMTLNTKIFTKYKNIEEIVTTKEERVMVNPVSQSISSNIEITNEKYKGYLYENAGNETIYNKNDLIEITDVISSEEINITNDNVYIYNQENGEIKISTNDRVYFKSTIINKEQMLDILGNEGYVIINDANGNEINKITKDSQEDENGNIVINYANSNNVKLNINISKPVKEGILSIDHTKAILADTGYTAEQIQRIKALEEAINVNGISVQAKMNLLETKAEAKIELSNNNLSTLQKNENVQMVVTIRSCDMQYDLYKDPYVEIIIPKELKVEVKTINQLNFQGMEIKKVESSNRNGQTVIGLQIIGTQTKYEDEITEGLQIVITADITIDNIIPSQTLQIGVNYTNAFKPNILNSTTTDVNLNSKEGILIVSRVSNYNNNEDTIQNIDDKILEAKLDINTSKRVVNVEKYIVNNYDNNTDNTVIIGKMLNVGEHEYNGETENVTFETKLINAINVSTSNARVYYSQDINATKDSDTWTENVEDFSSIKAFKIELNENKLNSKEVIKVDYQIEIPENLDLNQKAIDIFGLEYVYDNTQMEICSAISYETLTAYEYIKENGDFENVQGEGVIEAEEIEEDIQVQVVAKTKGEILEDGQEIQEGQNIKYIVKISNKKDVDIHNLKLLAEHTNMTYYGTKMVDAFGVDYPHVDEEEGLQNKELTVETLKAGETVTLEYEMTTKQAEEGANTTGTIKISADEIEEKEIKAYTNPIKQGKLRLKILSGYAIGQTIDSKDYAYPIEMYVKNIAGQDIENVEINLDLPEILISGGAEHMQCLPEDIEVQKNILEDNKVTLTIPKLEADKELQVQLLCRTNGMDTEKDKETITVNFDAKVGNEEYISNDLVSEILQAEAKIEAIQSGSIEGEYVQTGDNLVLQTKITNTGLVEKDITISNELPTGIVIKDAYILNSEGRNNDAVNVIYQVVMGTYTMKAEEEITLVIETTIDASIAEQDVFSSIVELSGYNVDVTSNEITYKVKKEQSTGGNGDEENNGQQIRKSISGKIWVDANEDGVKDDGEPSLEGIEVMLFNQETNSMVTSTNTSIQGEYKFEGLSQGKYIVIFRYDTTQYRVTQYKKDGVNQSQNSDVIAKQVSIDNMQELVALTDTLELVDVDLTNIDAGLIRSKTFDLKLDKSIGSIDIQNSAGKTTKNYGETKLAKVELHSKVIASTTVYVNYKIKVTNEGEVSGYVNEIADYIPEGFTFDASLNKGWENTQANTLVTKQLANEIINPGETKTIDLILIKKMTLNNMGTSINTAEINQSSNDLLILDKDSTPGNKQNGEDDISTAELLISISTGEIITYTVLIIFALVTITLSIVIIKKKVLPKNR